MEKLNFTKEQKQILDMQILYPQKGVCYIGGSLKEKLTSSSIIFMTAIKYALEDSLIFHIQITKDNTPYLAKTEIELSEWQNKEEPSEEQVQKWMGETRPFYNAPLYELHYWTDGEYIIFYLKAHHIILDGYSFTLILKKYKRYCRELISDKYPTRQVDDSYISLMKKEDINNDKENKWIYDMLLPGMPEQWKVRKTELGKIESKIVKLTIEKSVWEKIATFIKQRHLTFEIIAFGALSIYLSRITGADRVCIGRSMFNRTKKDINMVGIKVNQMPVFIDIDGENSFAKHCKIIAGRLFEMMRFSSASITEYMKKNGISDNYYYITVSYRNSKLLPLSETNMQIREITSGYQEIPLRIYLNEKNEKIEIEVQYQTEVYKNIEIQTIFGRLLHIVEQGIDGVAIGRCTLCSSYDYKMWDKINKDYNKKINTRLLINEICNQNNKDALAVIYDDLMGKREKMSYQELWDKADNIAYWLYNHDVHAGEIVGVQMRISELVPAVFLGIWQVGAAFLPISIDESSERVERLTGQCSRIITQKDALNAVNYSRKNGKLPIIQPEMTAYCMYTSGSMGMPKLVMISHASLAWRVHWMISNYGNSGTVLQKAAYTFDVSMWEFFLPLCQGELLYLLPDVYRANPEKIVRVIQNGEISTIHFVPAMLNMFLSYIEEKKIVLPEIKHVYSSGEALLSSSVQKFYRCFRSAKLHNLYGPTECTIDVTYYDCTGEETIIPIGKPLPGTIVEITDDKGEKVPVGIEGNLVIGGILVGQGYYGNIGGAYYTDFETGVRKYNTGDRAVLGYDGLIYYCGRSDRQCKINGMRIDLDQIEDCILHIPEVIRAAVVKVENQIIGIYMSQMPIGEIKQKIAEKLPRYSVPTDCIWIDNIPLTKNGKTDYHYLRQYIIRLNRKKKIKKPKNQEEKIIVSHVKQVMNKDVSIDENLFLAGLDSLQLMELILKLENDGYFYTAEEFYNYGTVEKIVSERENKIQWLYKGNNSRVVIAFPYAAGTSNAYRELAYELGKYGIDFGVTRSDQLLDVEGQYENIILLGYCTGTVLALEAYEKIENKGSVSGIVLCAALPPDRLLKRMSSPWKKINDKGLGILIEYLHREHVEISDAVIKKFRKDSDAYIEYFRTFHNIKTDKVLFIFGEKDILTYNCKKKWERWTNYICASFKMIIFQGEYHFFLNSKKKEMAELIKDILIKER